MKTKSIFLFFFLISFCLQVSSQVFPASLVGRWTFDNPLDPTHATVGNDLILSGSQSVMPGPAAGDTAVVIDAGSYYICNHSISANGGGTLVNEYSIMFDFMIQDPMVWHCFYQTSPTNSNDGEVFINTTGNIGISLTGYSGFSVQPNAWHRLVIAVDLGTSIKYYMDGQLILNGTSQAVDGRYSLELSSLLFLADDNGEDNLINVSQIALFNSPLSDGEVYLLGGFTNSNIMPYLQTPTPNSMYVSWNSYDNASTKVEYGTTPLLGSTTIGSYENISTNRWHTVKLAGLLPGTRYYYRCISGIDTSDVFHFRTVNDFGNSDGHLRFAVIGDSQTNVGIATAIADSMLNTFIDLFGADWSDSISLVFHTGDIMGNGAVIGSYMSEYFIPFSKISCHVPFMVSIGNHVSENGNFYSFMKYEDFSDNAYPNTLCEKYYSFYLGDCQFIALNTNGLYNNALQTNWLSQKLLNSDNNVQCDFVFSFSHQPGESELWPDGNTAYVWNNVYNVLKTFPKVAMHSTGHSHNYERAVIRTNHLMNWDFRTVLTGGGGGDLDRWGMYTNQTDYTGTQRSLDHYNYVIADVDMNIKKCVTTMYSLGNPDKPLNNVIMDQWHRIINQPAPAKPFALNPDSVSDETPVLMASPFSGTDSLMSSHFQLTGKYSSWNNLLIDTLRDGENVYGVTSAPGYLPINLNSGINLQQLNVPTGILMTDSSYKWRIRYRDHNVRWGEWSDSVCFTVSAVRINEVDAKIFCKALPNPFSNNVSLDFNLANSEHLIICINDIHGKLIRLISDKDFAKGIHHVNWDGTDSFGNIVSSGLYFCSFKTNTYIKNIKLIFESQNK